MPRFIEEFHFNIQAMYIMEALHHFYLIKRMAKGGDEIDAIEYINYNMETEDYLDNTLKASKLQMDNETIEYYHIINFAGMHIFSVASLRSEGREDLALSMEDRLRSIYRSGGYSENEIEAGLRLSKSLIESIPPQGVFHDLRTLEEIIRYDKARLLNRNI